MQLSLKNNNNTKRGEGLKTKHTPGCVLAFWLGMSETIRGSGKRRLKWDFQAKKWRWNYLGLILASAFRLEMVTELQNMTAQPGWNTWLSVFSTLGFRVECSQWALLSSRFPQSQSQHPSSAMKVLVMKGRFLILFLLLLLLCRLRICWGLMGLLWAINNQGWAGSQGDKWSVPAVMPSAGPGVALV